MSERDVTLAEVYRLLLDTKREHGERLDQIYGETRKTNGNVIRHEERLRAHDLEIRDLKRSRAAAPMPARPGAPADGSDGARRIVISLPADKSTIAAVIATAGGLIAGAVMAWLQVGGTTP